MSELTTLIYLKKNDMYLMMHRISKKNDINKDKWLGIGGHFEKNESPTECIVREVKEETGYEITNPDYRGIVTFVMRIIKGEYVNMSMSLQQRNLLEMSQNAVLIFLVMKANQNG